MTINEQTISSPLRIQLEALAKQTGVQTPELINRDTCAVVMRAIADNTHKKAITKLNDCVNTIRIVLEQTNDPHAAEFAEITRNIDFDNLDHVKKLHVLIDQICYQLDVQRRRLKWDDKTYADFVERRLAGHEDPNTFLETPEQKALKAKLDIIRDNNATIRHLIRALTKLAVSVMPMFHKEAAIASEDAISRPHTAPAA